MYQNIYEKFVKVEKKRSQVLATLVGMLIVAYFLMGHNGLLYLLVYHFMVRLYLHPLLSPLEWMATGIVSWLKMEKVSFEQAGKEFTSHLALTMLSLSLLLGFLNYVFASYALLAVLLVWSVLEAGKNICMGCTLYDFIERKGIRVVSL